MVLGVLTCHVHRCMSVSKVLFLIWESKFAFLRSVHLTPLLEYMEKQKLSTWSFFQTLIRETLILTEKWGKNRFSPASHIVFVPYWALLKFQHAKTVVELYHNLHLSWLSANSTTYMHHQVWTQPLFPWRVCSRDAHRDIHNAELYCTKREHQSGSGLYKVFKIRLQGQKPGFWKTYTSAKVYIFLSGNICPFKENSKPACGIASESWTFWRADCGC